MTAPVMLGRERRDRVTTLLDFDWVRFAAPDTPARYSPNDQRMARRDFAETGLCLSSG